jgi:hypothetical protein
MSSTSYQHSHCLQTREVDDIVVLCKRDIAAAFTVPINNPLNSRCEWLAALRPAQQARAMTVRDHMILARQAAA